MTTYPWLIPIYQQVIQTFLQQRGHHALLFRAEQGVGVENLIRDIADWLLCQQPQGNTACKQCQSCHLNQTAGHPDLHILAPIENKDIGIDQVREINEKILQFAQQQGNKIVYLQGVERLTESAANALLKSLEEPRPNTYFLLQADASSNLLATIYSRCQVWLVPTPPIEMSQQWLAQHWHSELDSAQQQIEQALAINYGRPLLALKMLEKDELEKRRQFLRQFWLFYQRRDVLQLLPSFEKEKEDVLQQLDWLNLFISDSLKTKLNIQTHCRNLDLMRGIRQFAAQLNVQSLLQANQILLQMRNDLQFINGVNQELILVDGLMKFITEVFKE